MYFLFLIFASLAISIPVTKRYDFDHNGIPDWCYEGLGDIEHCLDATGTSWTTFLASSTVLPTITTNPPPPSLTASPTSTVTEKVAATMAPLPTASLPDPATFKAASGNKWTIKPIGPIFSSTIDRLGWDKGRTSSLSGTWFWNFGDVLSLDGWAAAGFSMGAAYYADPSNMLRVDMKNITNVYGKDFAQPYAGDPAPDPKGPTPFWGMDTSNVAEVTPGVGIGFVWEIWRSPEGPYEDRGSGIIRVTLGEVQPIADRTGPLVTGPDGLQVGLMTIMIAEGYLYTYTNGGPTGIVIGRVAVADAFDATKYEFLKTDGTWVQGIPKSTDMSYGIQGKIHSDGQGSIMWSNYFKKYLLFTCAFGQVMNFYTSDTPYGPWSDEYYLLQVPGYGVNVHPELSPDGNHQVLYISSGAENIITMYKIEFNL